MPETWNELIARQHGIFTVAQALDHGLTRQLLRDRRRDGLYRKVAPSTLYAGGAIELSARARLWRAVLCLNGAVLSHLTAARLWDLRVPECAVPHVTVLRANWRQRDGLRIHTSDSAASLEPAIRCDLPVTRLERSLIDSFGICDNIDDRQTLVAEAFRRRRVTITRISQVLREMPQTPRRSELFRTIELASGGSHSRGEMKLLDFMTRWSLPTPVRQYLPQLPRGRRYVDCALTTYRIAVEYDGRHHLTDAQRHDDQLRDEALRRLKWITIRVSDRRLRDEKRLAADLWANISEQAQRLGVDRPPGS